MYSSSAFLIFLISSLLSICAAAPLQPHAVEKRSGVPTLVGNAVVFGAGTYPRANMLADGSLIGAYTAFSGGYNILTTVKSTDGGQT